MENTEYWTILTGTVNVDIFACIHFRGFMKKDNFAWIKIHVLCITGSLGYCKSNFHIVHVYILEDI